MATTPQQQARDREVDEGLDGEYETGCERVKRLSSNAGERTVTWGEREERKKKRRKLRQEIFKFAHQRVVFCCDGEVFGTTKAGAVVVSFPV
jgi:hypothetical protein